MAATGNEATRLSQLKSWWDTTIATINASINNKLDKPGTAATAGQVLSNNGTQNVWIDAPSGGETYTGTAPINVSGTAPINVSGTTISVAEAGEGTLGVVRFASDTDFKAYMGIS